MKGAADGGLDVPHNEKRFPGYDRDTKQYDVRMHAKPVHICRELFIIQETNISKFSFGVVVVCVECSLTV